MTRGESGFLDKLAVISPYAMLGYDVVVMAFAMIGVQPSQCASLARKSALTLSVSLGDDCEVRPHAVIYGGSTIGSDCLIGDGATVREGARIGNRCIVGTRVFIGYDAELADEVRVQTGSHISDGWKIGKGTFVGINVSTMSDLHPEGYEFHGSVITTIGERCLIGSGSVILPGLTIGDDVVIGAGALVTGDVPSGATVLGQPARIKAVDPRHIPSVNGADHWSDAPP